MKTKRHGRGPWRRVYLVSPRTPASFWSMQGTVQAVGARALMPSNTLATLMALTPPDVGVEYVLCDENLREADLALPCDLVALTGYTVHAERLAELSRAWRARGVPVALGGPFATLNRARARPLADHLFLGEGEHTWPRFLREWSADRAADLYEQPTHVDLADSPAPDWSLVDGRDYLYLTVQTSRGCPNRCDFCDAIQLVGRRYRTKSLAQILLEVENAQRAGAETVFFSEDNFYVDRAFTRELLQKLIAWNTSLAHPIQFSCQTSIRITDDEDILRLLADARFAALFIGVESVRQACLEEVHKGHLYRADLAERLKRLSRYGLLPLLGLIVGFDADDRDTFAELDAFMEETACPIASVSVLNAPDGTPLHQRLEEQGRIVQGFAGKWHLATNIVPLQWPVGELVERQQALFRGLYEPARFEARVLRWLARTEYFTPLYRNRRRHWRNVFKLAAILRHYCLRAPAPVRRSFFRVLAETWRLDRRRLRKAVTIFTQYCHYYDFVQRPVG